VAQQAFAINAKKAKATRTEGNTEDTRRLL
jgi:hypothetical protein